MTKTDHVAPGIEDQVEPGEFVSHARAQLAAARLIDSYFENGAERPRISIPANPDRDDDMLLMRYIREQRYAETLRFSQQTSEPASDPVAVARDALLMIVGYERGSRTRLGGQPSDVEQLASVALEKMKG